MLVLIRGGGGGGGGGTSIIIEGEPTFLAVIYYTDQKKVNHLQLQRQICTISLLM